MEFHVQTTTEAATSVLADRVGSVSVGLMNDERVKKFRFYSGSGILGGFDNQVSVALGAEIILY